ncbi:unnamed protein product [Didymodactylos carnosus]|uniref:Uncharacterized protein n=1 Tax=Didymodactylos carnosus TaxID=1234261 RepID=A0A8S2ER75_9BILA|nr:unnamed protein product [Didymodactylos carnosus]CAF4026248.1 unnamed protein product [Didymodactylos carnosus]
MGVIFILRQGYKSPTYIKAKDKVRAGDKMAIDYDFCRLKVALITDNKCPYQLQKTLLKLTSDYDLNKSQKEQTGSVLDIKNQVAIDRQHVFLFVALV